MMVSRWQSRISDSGATLVELVAVMALLAILGVVVIPRFDAYREIEIGTVVRSAAADIRYAQSRSIATRVRHGVVFDPAADRYLVYQGDPATPAPDFFKQGAPMRRSWQGIDITAAGFDGGLSIEFDSMGTPFNSAGNELASAGFVVFSRGSVVDTVRVLALTGRVVY